jgi:hypothetical protein
MVSRLVPLAMCFVAACALPVNGLGDEPEGGAGSSKDAGVGVSAVDASGSGGDDDASSATIDGGAADDGESPAPDASAPGADASPDSSASDAIAPTGAGTALQFAGGAYVALAQVPIPAEFTVEAWVEPTSVTGETSIVAEDRNGQVAGQFRLALTGSRQLFFIMSDVTGNTGGLFDGESLALVSPQTVPVGTWTHVAVTRSKQGFALFVNGVQVDAFNPKGAALVYGGPPVPLRIAARVAQDGTSADEAFTGTIDEVRFWNVARTATQVAGSMHQEVSPSDATLLGYWRFDEGSGTTASDARNAFPGTLVGGPVWVPSKAF